MEAFVLNTALEKKRFPELMHVTLSVVFSNLSTFWYHNSLLSFPPKESGTLLPQTKQTNKHKQRLSKWSFAFSQL
jgi:hypothetical protein